MRTKNERGSITIFVLIGLLFMTSILIITYSRNLNNSKIVKEQYNIISDIYMPSNNIVESYTEVYTDLRAKRRDEQLNKTVEYKSQIEIEKCYAEDISNYKIYGSENGLGKFVSEYNKYEIVLRVRDIKEENIDGTKQYQEEIYKIYLDNLLTKEQYIDYKTSKIYHVDTKEEIQDIENLPKLKTYEDYTNIKIYSDENEEETKFSVPTKIEIEYVGYTFDEEEKNED